MNKRLFLLPAILFHNMKTHGITRGLLLALAWVASAALTLALLNPMRDLLTPTAPRRYFPPDFMQFYFAGQLAAEGRIAQLYHQPAYERLVRETGMQPNQIGVYPIIRPPFVAYLCIPLTWFRHRTALLLLTLINIALLAVLVWKLPTWFSLPSSLRPLLLSFYPFLWSIGLSQDILLLTALMAYGLFSAFRGNEARAGILLGLCVFKPHLIWLVPVAWLAGGKRKATEWFAITAVTLAFISLLSVGFGGFREWMGLLQQPYSDYRPETMGNLRAILLHFGRMPAVVAGGVTLACAGLILLRGSLNQKLSAAVLSALVLSPHTYTYDFSLLAVVAVLATHPVVRYGVLLPWPYFYPRDDLLPWILAALAYLIVMAVRPAANPKGKFECLLWSHRSHASLSDGHK